MTLPSPQNAAALDFLKKVYPTGPWVLTAIRPDPKAIETKTFRPENARALVDWLDNYNGKRNIYWSTNPPLRDLTKKAEREDIKEVAYLHVDIDPRAGEDLEAERKRILSLFEARLPDGVPAPTCVIFSGGGYQAFWRLAEPIPISGDVTLAENAKRYNQQLERLFGGDNCHNIDRIMRLPGTINVPDAKKLKKGRVPTLATLEVFAHDRVYPLREFTPVPPTAEAPTAGHTHSVDVSNIVRLGNISELDKYGVSDRVKVICVQGKQPDEHKARDNSRSAWLYDAVCNLVRAGVPDEVIYATITDPRFGISASVLDKSSPGKYAIKQIENAHNEAALPDWLLKMNSEYAYIGQVGGRQRILWQDGKRNIFMTKGDVKEFPSQPPLCQGSKSGWHRGQNRAVRGMASFAVSSRV